MKNKLNSKGFTLVELLAVIIILAVIVAIAVPKINSVIADAKQESLNDSAALITRNAETYVGLSEMSDSYDSIADLDTALEAVDGGKYGYDSIACTAETCTLTFTAVSGGKFDTLTAVGTYSFDNPRGTTLPATDSE